MDDAIRIRLAAEDDWHAVYEHQARTFGVNVELRDIEAWKKRVQLEDILVVEDISDPEHPYLVATSLCYRLRLTVPGGASLDAPLLAMVTVAATHRNRGIWQQVSARGFGMLMERDYPILCGVPTRTPMYEVLGAGVATYTRTYNVDPRSAKLRTAPGPSRAREVTAAEAARCLPPIYDRWCEQTHGALSRDSAWWGDYLQDRSTQRDDGSSLSFIVHPDGFLTYRVLGASPHAYRPPFGTVVVQDFCPITAEAHTELLSALLVLDLFDNIAIQVPVDDPLPLKLKDQRAAATAGIDDFLWLRIMNIPDALSARQYGADVDIVLEITDPLNVAGGTFLLQTGDGSGKCTPHDGPADIKIGLGDLGSIYMGAHRPVELSRAGRISELRSGALADLDAAFSVERAPYCGMLL